MSLSKDIRDAVERELSYDPLVDDSDISVKNINGDVTLNGTVPSYPQCLEAAAAARRIAGVWNLQNHLEPASQHRQEGRRVSRARPWARRRCAMPDQHQPQPGVVQITGVKKVAPDAAIQQAARDRPAQ